MYVFKAVLNVKSYYPVSTLTPCSVHIEKEIVRKKIYRETWIYLTSVRHEIKIENLNLQENLKIRLHTISPANDNTFTNKARIINPKS